mgnify:CR=1 FL=1
MISIKIMVKKIIKDIFVKEKKIKPLDEELKMAESSGKKILLKLVMLIIAVILVGGFGAVIVGKISSAVIKITPRQEFMDTDSKLKASRLQQGENAAPDMPDGSRGERAKSDNPVFEIMQLEKEEARAVVATGVAADGKKASGQIVVYNNYSSANQLLIANTRFEAPDGKVYRIKERINVPGMGSKEVTVYADQPGEEYNMGLVDFTIPGLKGGLRYGKVYARSKTEMKGGASGNVRIMKEEDIEKIKKELVEKIKNDLIKSLAQQKPDGYLVYKDAVRIEYQYDPNNPKTGDASGSSLFKVKGMATGFLMEKNNLSKSLVNDNAKKFEKTANIYVANLEDLEFDLLSADSENKNINFKIKGNARFVWGVDTGRLMDDLISHKGGNYEKVFQNYPDIKKAEIIIKPSWWPRVPKNKAKIKVEEIINVK